MSRERLLLVFVRSLRCSAVLFCELRIRVVMVLETAGGGWEYFFREKN